MKTQFSLNAVQNQADDAIFFRPMIQAAFGGDTTERDWKIECAPRSVWIRVSQTQSITPPQGWKLHVSAASFSAIDVLNRALPILRAENASFKIAASTEVLDLLNSGGERSQIGKFITIYPNDDAQAVRLAVALDDATRGLRGPAILSDRALNKRSLLHYRYGDFSGQRLQAPTGEVVSALRAPDGTLVPDPRATHYQAPPWAVDPFVEAGIATVPTPPQTLKHERYLITGKLFESPSGGVWMALDTQKSEPCVLKMARRDAGLKRDGRDARDRLRNEYKALQCLQEGGGDKCFPRALDWFEESGDVFLVQSDVPGERLDRHFFELRAQCRFLSSPRIARWGAEISAMLQTIHDKGWIYRDLKPANLFIAPDQTLKLIDFDIAHEIASTQAPLGNGTRGYLSPQAQSGESQASVADDIYSLGALLFFAATNAESSEAPHPFALLERPLRLLNPRMDERLEKIIARCLEADEEARFASASEVERALHNLDIEYSKCANTNFADANITNEKNGFAVANTTPFISELLDEKAFSAKLQELDASQKCDENTKSNVEIARRCGEYARRMGDSICALAQTTPDKDGVLWLNAIDPSQPPSRDLAIGNSGTLLALAEIVAQWDQPQHRETLRLGAQLLARAPRPDWRRVSGLYIGEAGVGAALLRAGQVLQDEKLIEAASQQSQWIGSQPHTSPDLFNGSAGRLRFHLWACDETAETVHLEAATCAAETLLDNAATIGNDEMCWVERSAHGEKRVLGYAHGAAGIADSLLDFFEATGDERFREAARKTALWLSRQMIPVLDNDSGAAWPFAQGSILATPFWCHGAAGIGRFFLSASQFDVLPEAREIAQMAARSVAGGSRWAGPTQCHGLAGNIEFLLDMFRATKERVYLDQAHDLWQLLEAFATDKNDELVWSGNAPTQFAPIYMTGFAGIAGCLLRLSDPQSLPHQLSRDNFRNYKGQNLTKSLHFDL